jgi:hypothetical protein
MDRFIPRACQRRYLQQKEAAVLTEEMLKAGEAETVSQAKLTE